MPCPQTWDSHAAGLGGFGGSSYTDSVILRDRDASTPWHQAADSTREERRYTCQNWRADGSAILTDSGAMVEWGKYSAYGVPFALPAGDTDSDGDVDAADVTHADSITGGYQTLGRGMLSSSGVNNRRGYAGYEYDPTFQGASVGGRHIYHVRHRVYDADIGRWTRRDPLGYADGSLTPSLYEYSYDTPVHLSDPYGLQPVPINTPNVPFPPQYTPPMRIARPPAPVVPTGPLPTPAPCPKFVIPTGPAALCVIDGIVFYCIGDYLSPRIFPPIVPSPPRGNRPPPDPKRCSKAKHRALQDIVNRDCKQSDNAQPCNSNMSCDELLRREDGNRKCVKARRNVQKCFKPRDRDPGHKRRIRAPFRMEICCAWCR